MGVPPYGAQRELLLLSDTDGAGLPRHNPMPRAWTLWHVRGEVDVPRLAAAMRAVAAGNDVWRARFAAGPELVYGAEQPFPVTIVDCADVPADRRSAVAGAALGEAVYAPIDLRHDPLAGACLVRLAPDEHALALVVDHGFADHATHTRFVRRTAAAYEHPGRTLPPLPSFFAHAAEVATDPRRTASREFWAEAMSRDVPAVAFPGGRWKPWRDTTATTAWPLRLDRTSTQAIRYGRELTGATGSGLLLAALSFLLELWADADVPVLYARGGRWTRESVEVPGALHEAVVSVPPDHLPSASLADRIRALTAVNAAAPPLLGQWLTDFGGVEALRQRRRLVLNVVAAEPTVTLGGATIGPADRLLRGTVRPPAGRRDFPAHNALHLAVAWSAEQPEVTVHHDPEVLPAAAPFGAALVRFFALLAEQPDIAADRAADLLRATWLRAVDAPAPAAST
ncbi:condensation domain-containing protein [Micromonospora sp. HUAS LYJ1]|uniref:condensation domain-containing protein n=1 Tax=Micromonospora sp. HUAS LYJ1 TaxID=3061626 RepID=UPI002670F9F7|nr:condensation domain-containing protein [Micromonospora sp. HUAS LYJ1]WKU05363.1 condensation domain-containing protein [Micromonospora sp. HUAS LYJ1]